MAVLQMERAISRTVETNRGLTIAVPVTRDRHHVRRAEIERMLRGAVVTVGEVIGRVGGPVEADRGLADGIGRRPPRRLLVGAGPAEAEVHVILVAVGDAGAAVGLPAGTRVVGTPDLPVPDDVHDAEPASQRVLVALGIGGQQPVEQIVGDVALAERGDAPVPGAPLLVLALPARTAVAGDSRISRARVGGEHEVAEPHHPRFRGRVTGALPDVGLVGVHGSPKPRRGRRCRRRFGDGDVGHAR